MSGFLNRNRLIKTLATLVGLTGLGQYSAAQDLSHAYINTTRSGQISHYYLGVSIDTEFGNMKRNNEADEVVATNWQGYGINNQLGVEMAKFIQFYVSHVSLNLRQKGEGDSRLVGSRFMGGARFVFYAPLGNLEIGGGATSLTLEYLSNKGNSEFYGSGYFYELRYNYFLSTAVSFTVTARSLSENLVNNGGNADIKNLRSSTNVASFGWSLWF